jgi:hypothetical protein
MRRGKIDVNSRSTLIIHEIGKEEGSKKNGGVTGFGTNVK